MKTYSIDELSEIVGRLLQEKREGDYWDFKQEWHEHNGELVKDILCFANTVHGRDCFIIFGVDEKTYRVTPFQKSRKKQADVLDLLSNVHFAGENKPHISIFSDISVRDGMVDILIIHDSDQTPYYLSKPYDKLKAGIIYSRIGDRNTSINDNSSPLEIENLWKKRFGLTKPPLEQFYTCLKNPSEWTLSLDDGYYNVYRPEFSLMYKQEDVSEVYTEFFTSLFLDKRAFRHELYCKYHQTILKTFWIVSMDGGRFQSPFPDVQGIEEFVSYGNSPRFFYLTKNSPKYSILNLLYCDGFNDFQREMFFRNVLLFISKEEKEAFMSWLQLKGEYISEQIIEQESSQKDFSQQERYYKDCVIGKVMNHMLEIFRQQEAQHV